MNIHFTAVGAYCECGEKLQFTGDGYYTNMAFSSDGELIFAKCNHGNVCVDKRKIASKKLDNILSLS